MTFNEFEKKIEELEIIREKAHGNAQSEELQKYIRLFWELHEAAVELENSGKIEIEPGKKSIGYLKEIVYNDGPEFCYTIEFWPRGEEEKRYSIGVCVRGWPVLEKVAEVKRKTIGEKIFRFPARLHKEND